MRALAARLDLAGGQPAVHVGLDARARLEALVEHVDLADAVEAVGARLRPCRGPSEWMYQPSWPFTSLYGSIVRSVNSSSFSL